MIKRHLVVQIHLLIEDYPALIVTGPRQIGKSTMVKNLLHIDNLTHVSMDDQQIRDVITNQPNIFFKTYKTPLFIDEVQKAPSIFNNIKLIVDKNEQKGQFILTGSQKFKLMKGVTESLAGRAAILEMQSLSQSEINGFENFTFINSYEMMEKRYLKYHAKNSKININERIVNGSMPTIVTNQVKKRTNYYKSYIETVLFKDIDDDIVKLYNKVAFSKFLAIIANYSGNVINMNNIARHVNVDWRTISTWMNALEAIGVIFFLTPFINNTISRITKSPKLFFHDTGLLCYLLDINSELELFKHPNYGHIFETFVVSEINKSFINSGESMNLYYLQDKDVKNKEIDVIIEKGNRIYPIEIKTTSLVNKNNFKNFNLLKNNIKQDICPMIVVGTGEFLLKIDENKIFFPAWML